MPVKAARKPAAASVQEFRPHSWFNTGLGQMRYAIQTRPVGGQWGFVLRNGEVAIFDEASVRDVEMRRLQARPY